MSSSFWYCEIICCYITSICIDRWQAGVVSVAVMSTDETDCGIVGLNAFHVYKCQSKLDTKLVKEFIQSDPCLLG